jgi:gluconolactonase
VLGEQEAVDPSFRNMVEASAPLRVLDDGCRFTEGPVWFADLQCLLWSDIPNNRIMRWTPDGHVGVFRANSSNANGNTRDREGRLVTCEHGSRRVTRTEVDGAITVLADRFEGGLLNSPNDVVVSSDGAVWFTDPAYGLDDRPSQQAHESVYRLDPATGALSAVVSDFDKPNGLAFSPDERVLYIADSARSLGEGRNCHIRRFDVSTEGHLSGGAIFAQTGGIPDGFRVDTEGNVWTTAGRSVEVYAPSGALLGRIAGFPENACNLTFGGPDGDQLFITAGPCVYAMPVLARGAQWP